MGAANCCKKPDKIVIEELKYSTNDNNKFTAVDQDSYPQDTEQYRSNANVEDENAQMQAVSNKNLYEQEAGSPKIGGAYEVPINVSSPQNYEEGYESNNMGLAQQYENQNIEGRNLDQYEQENQMGYQYVENENMNININPQMAGNANAYEGNQEEQGIDYDALVNQMGNEASLKALRMGNAGLNAASASASYGIQRSQQAKFNNYNIQQNNIENAGGLDLNYLSSAQQGGIDLKSFNLREQQGGAKTTVQTSKKVEYNYIGNGGQDIDFKSFPLVEQQGGAKTTVQTSNKEEYNNVGNGGQQTTTTTTTTTTIKKQGAVNNYENLHGIKNSQVSQNEDDLNKYFQQATSKFASVNTQLNPEERENYYSKVKTQALPNKINIKQLAISAKAPPSQGLDLNNLLQQEAQTTQKSTVASVMPIKTNDDISKYFKQNIPSKQENIQPVGSVGPQDKKPSKSPEAESSQEIKITKIEIDPNEELPETLGSYNINNFKQTTTTVTKTTGNIDMKNLPEGFGLNDLKNMKQTTATTTTKTSGNVDLKDLPKVLGQNDIKNLKQGTTTITTNTIKKEGGEDFNLNDLNIDLKNYKLDMEDLPETFGSSNIMKIEQTTKTTTTTTTQKEGNINEKEINKARGPEDIKNIKQETTTTTTKTTGNIDLNDLKIDLKNYKLDMEDLPETFGSSNINNYKQTTTTTTTTTTQKKEGDVNNKESPKEVKQIITTTTNEGIIDMKDLPEVFGSFDINNFKQTTKTTTKEGQEVDLQNLPKNVDVNSLKQTTTTSTKEGLINTKGLPQVFDDKDIKNFKQTTTTTTTEGKIDMKDLPQVFGSYDINNFKQTTTTTTTKTSGNGPAIDLKDFGLEKNASLNPPTNSGNFKQTTTTTTTKTTGNGPAIDLKQFGIEQNPSTNPIIGNEDYSKYFQETSKINSEPIDLKQFGLEQNPSAMSNLEKTTKTTKTTKITTTSNNGNIDLKQFGIEQNPSVSPITGNEDYSKYFKETSQIASGPIDLKQFGLEQNSSSMSNLKQTTTTNTTKTTGNGPAIDLKQFEIEQNPSSNPITGNEDYSKYFQTTQTTTTKTTEPVDLKQFGIDVNSLASGGQQKTTKTTVVTTTGNAGGAASSDGLDLGVYGLNNTQQKTTTTTTTTKITGNTNLNNLGIPTISAGEYSYNYGLQNASANAISSSGAAQGTNKMTTTKVTKTSYVAPTTQSYSYNYNYNMPTTSSTKVTKTTYSQVAPGSGI